MARQIVAATIGIVLIPLAVSGQILSQQLISSDPVSCQAALRRLATLSPEQKSRYARRLLPWLGGKQANRAVHAFAKIGPSAVPALVNLLQDPDPVARGSAAKAIAAIRPVEPESSRKLRLLLKDKDSWVQRRVAESLMSIGVADEEAESILREQWPPDGSPAGPKPAGTFTDWIPLLASDDVIAAADAVYYLKSAGEPAVPDLIAALKNQNPKIRWGAAEALQKMHLFRPDIEAGCIRALQDPFPRVRDLARSVLIYRVSEAAMDALLQDEIAEIARKKALLQSSLQEKTQPHSRAEVLAPIPAGPEHNYPLEVSNQFEMKAPDGTTVFVVLFTGKQRGDSLRVWIARQDGYHLFKKFRATDSVNHVSAEGFRYHGKAYLHVKRVWEGTGYQHRDEFFRIEGGGLTQLQTPKAVPIELGPDEGIWKGAMESFKDDNLEFQFGIWKKGDGNCCPTAGWVKGTYTILGNELKYATLHRSNDIPK
ncbi:MAG: HEAT repeat domain-containing protein [Candidatus Solibacter usitatus]|nr:HEAT repeat domain-containing protein [Candidatus Solibacter usitatus]